MVVENRDVAMHWTLGYVVFSHFLSRHVRMLRGAILYLFQSSAVATYPVFRSRSLDSRVNACCNALPDLLSRVLTNISKHSADNLSSSSACPVETKSSCIAGPSATRATADANRIREPSARTRPSHSHRSATVPYGNDGVISPTCELLPICT
ncbi:hypothetical protein PLICRDRAFT_525532 [Plicaturopsis crispa FD-325 SS-3]|nr:hypothetical protein PLICRDRAFT_525532 [Plicaturopsis crispa FD-325 SS-3]